MLCDWLVRKTGRRRLCRALFPVLGYATAAAAMQGMRFVETPTQAAALLCLVAVGADFGQAANWATIVDIGGRYAGMATGFINMIGNLGSSVGPVISAGIFKYYGWPALFAVYSGTFLLAAAMWIFINPARKFYHERLQAEEAHRIEELL
jgi:nitrate/nitrite transporter NarK